MTPEMIVYAALAAELDLIAICDHNHAGNAAAVQQAAARIAGDYLIVLAGMEITSREETHLLAYFATAEYAEHASNALANHLPNTGPGKKPFGNQPLMDESGAIIGTVDRMLCLATDLSLEETAGLVRNHHGLVVAAHIDRPSFSVLSQLGFIPEDIQFDALELSAAGCKQNRMNEFIHEGITLITASDAHFLQNVGDARVLLTVEEASFSEFQKALHQQDGRKCQIA